MAKIRGINYNSGSTFTTAYTGTWCGSADGGNGSGPISTNRTVTFYEDRTGWADWYYYPILCKGGGFNGGDYFWTTIGIFPFAWTKVVFNGNGGANQSTRTYTWATSDGTQVGNFPSTSRTGYDHSGWKIGNTTYGATQKVYSSWVSNNHGKTLTAYAQWTAKTYTIYYNANGGTGGPSSQTKTYGSSMTITSSKPSRIGYDFLGWSTSNSATTETWKAGSTYNTDEGYGSTRTLYAVWKASTSPIINATDVILSLDNQNVPYSTITWKPNESSFKFKIKAQLPSAAGNPQSLETNDYITVNSTNQQTFDFQFDSSWINSIYKGNSSECLITLYTYNSSNELLGYHEKEINLTLPSGLNPSLTLGNITSSGRFSNTAIFSILDTMTVNWTFTVNSQSPSPFSKVVMNIYNIINNTRETENGIVKIEQSINTSIGTTANGITTGSITSNLLTKGIKEIDLIGYDQRGNTATITSNRIVVYNYVQPFINIQYLSNKKLEITGNISYVGGQNSYNIYLSVYEGNNTQPEILNNNDETVINITPTLTASGNYEYEKYYSINFENGYDLSSYETNGFLDLDSNTYRFEVTVQDSINTTGVAASCFSAVPVMTFEAGGNKITAHKPTTFEQSVTFEKGIQPMDSSGVTGVEILPTRLSDRLGGRIKLDRGEDTARDVYIDTYEDRLRFVDRNPSTTVRATLNMTNGSFSPEHYYYLSNGQYIECHPPVISTTTVSDGHIINNSSYQTTAYFIQKEYQYQSGQVVPEIWGSISFYCPLSNTAGAVYYDNVKIALPSTFYNIGTGNIHFVASAQCNSGVGWASVWKVESGGLYISICNSKKPSSGTWAYNLNIHGIKW